jgi:hypothetical protein
MPASSRNAWDEAAATKGNSNVVRDSTRRRRPLQIQMQLQQSGRDAHRVCRSQVLRTFGRRYENGDIRDWMRPR